MADKPIIFSAPMVRALLDGRKTQTRRVLKGKSGVLAARSVLQLGAHWLGIEYDRSWPLRLPYPPGDRLYVREGLKRQETDQGIGYMTYAADGAKVWPLTEWRKDRHSIPSIHMPRWASRLTLTVTDVRVQRLQEITAEECTAEGVPFESDALAPYEWSVSRFADLWNSLHGPDAWDANPWVMALTFKVQRGNIDTMEASK